MRVYTLVSILLWCCSWVFAGVSDTVVFTNQTLNFRNLSSIVDRRTDFCSRAQMLANRSLALKDALRGIHMTVVVPIYSGNEAFFELHEPGHTSSGFMYDVLHELADMSGMQFTIHTHPASSFIPDMSWTQYAVVAATKYDLVIDWFLETAERLNHGLRSPHTFMDLSLELTTSQTETEPSFYEKFWQFAKPFSNELWGILVGITMGTAILYVAVERRYSKHDFLFDAPLEYNVCNVFFLSFMQFTQITHLSPITRLGKVIVAAYSFVIFVAAASYTANLASILVISKSVTTCSSVEACLASVPGSKVCVMDKTAMADSLLALYPYLDKNQQIHLCPVTYNNPFECYAAGHCTAVVYAQFPTEMMKRKKEYNADCTLSHAETLLRLEGGWVGQTDYSDRCTSSLLDALEHQLLAMRLQGKLKPLKDAALKASETMIPCSSRPDKGTSDGQIMTEDMMGLFILYGCIAFVAVATYYAYQIFCPSTVKLAEFPLTRTQERLQKEQEKNNTVSKLDKAIGHMNDIKATFAQDADPITYGPIHVNDFESPDSSVPAPLYVFDQCGPAQITRQPYEGPCVT